LTAAPRRKRSSALRDEGFNQVESISGLIKAGGMPYSDASRAVLRNPIWADQCDRVTTNKWIDPPDPPDRDAPERLTAAFREEPRIAAAWITGSRVTRADGSSHESTGVALILDLPFGDLHNKDESRRSAEFVARLDRVAPQANGRRSWLFVREEVIAAHAGHCKKIYTRTVSGP